MFNFQKRGGRQPSIIPTDKVVPLRKFDNVPLSRGGILYSTFVFDIVLDPAKLESSLASLLERDGWNKLAGRLRYNENGEFVYHIPREFTNDRPAVRFYHVEYDMAAEEHPVASRLRSMKPLQTPTVMADPNTFRSLLLHPGLPTKLSHYLERDEPQLGLVVVSFHDTTLVTLSWQHTVFDIMGFGELIHAWSHMLRGQHNMIATPHDPRTDPLAELGCHPTQPYHTRDPRLSWLQMAILALWAVYEYIFHTYQSRVICLPANFVRKLRAEAQAELSRCSEDDAEPFLSEGDVLFAWWAQLYVGLEKSPKKLTNILIPVGLRSTLAQDLLPSNKPYLSNAVGLLNVLVPSRTIVSRPLCYVAAQIRQGLTDFRTRAQIEAYFALWRESKYLICPLFGTSNTRMMPNTNWTKAKLLDLDFSAAIVQRRTRYSSDRPGFPTYTQCLLNDMRSNLAIILGKDSEGNYWVNGIAEKDHWARIEEVIMNDGRLATRATDYD